MKTLTEQERNRKVRIIDGISFIFYKKYKNEEQALEEQRKFKEDGYYTRRLQKVELWVSQHPRWFFKLPALFENGLTDVLEE